MIKIINPAECCGCSACAESCPVSCILMKRDSEGFSYPSVNEDKCINCGLCEKICPIISKKAREATDVVSYAALTKLDDVRKNSSSGGLFYELGMTVIEEGGIVFGACLDNDLNVVHEGAENEKELMRLLGSKYVQSDISTVLPIVKAELERGRKVLFSGTPCQVGGLYAYLKKPYENLISVDLICHGVPSPEIWEKYIRCREEKTKSAADKVSFRDKSTGWRGYSIKINFENGMTYSDKTNNDSYMRAFLYNLSIRPSCYECHFKGEERYSDITLGDFWGIEHVLPDMDDNKGVSLLMIRSRTGKDIIEKISARLNLKEVDIDLAISSNSAYIKSAVAPKMRDVFISEIMGGADFDTTAKKYTKPGFVKKFRRFIKGCLKLVTGK